MAAEGRPDVGANYIAASASGAMVRTVTGTARTRSGSTPRWVFQNPEISRWRPSSAAPRPPARCQRTRTFSTTSREASSTTNMPSWRPLTPQDRANLIAMVKAFSPRWMTEKSGTPISIPSETKPTIDSILNGRKLFQNMQCWKCHGPEGRGDGPSSSTLTNDKGQPIRPYDFSTGLRFKCGATNVDLYRIFMTGLDGTPMPSFADQLKPEEAWDLVHFLRTLQTSLKPPELATFQEWEHSHPGVLKPIGQEQAPGTGD